MLISARRTLFLQCNSCSEDSNEGKHAVVVDGGCGVLVVWLCTRNRWLVLPQEPYFVELTIGSAAVAASRGRIRGRSRGIDASLSRGRSSGLSSRGRAWCGGWDDYSLGLASHSYFTFLGSERNIPTL